MRLIFDGQKFILLCSFGEDKQAIDAGFNWSGKDWWTGQSALANKFAQVADARAKEMLRRYDQKLMLSNATSIEGFNPPVPDGLAYLPFQKAGGYFALQRHTTLIADEMGLGKDQPLTAKVLTPTGWKLMGEMQKGMAVVGSDGGSYEVTAVYPQGVKNVYRVNFNDGTSTECGEEHLWYTFSPQQLFDRRAGFVNRKVGKVQPLKKVAEWLVDKSGNFRHYIPIIKPVVFESSSSNLPLAPYALGFLLGDGCFSGTPGTNSVSVADTWCKEKLAALLPVGLQYAGGIDYRICNKGSEKVNRADKNPVTDIIRSLGLEGKHAWDKFIPDQYKFASIDDREELIRGLFDADGSRYNGGVTVEYTSCSKQLAEDAEFILQSLGCVVYKSTEPSWYVKEGIRIDCRLTYRLIINAREGFECFSLPRKLLKSGYKRKYFPVRAIKSVEYLGQKETQCITTSAPDGLYVTDNFIVTHNTISDILIANADVRITSQLFILPADLMINWYRELQKWSVRQSSIDSVEGKNFPKSDIVLISYDMVMKHRSSILSREWHKITRDESHYIKNPETQRSLAVLGGEVKDGRKILEILEPIKATHYDIFLTGTPILNRPVELWPTLKFGDPSGLGANYYSYTKRYCKAWKAPWGMDVSGASNLPELQDRLRSSIMVRRLKKDVLLELPPKRRQLVTIPGDALRKVLSAELDFYQKYQQTINEIRDKVERDSVVRDDQDEDEAYSEAVKRLMPTKADLWEEMSRLRHQTALAKVPFMISWLDNVLEQKEKVACYVHHRDVMLMLQGHFKDRCVLHHGGMSKTQKQDSVDRFQGRKDITTWLGSITTAKGYTVTASSYAMIGELDWRPGIVSQAEDRHHRIGQKDWVLIQHLVFDNSFDSFMAQTIVQKQEVIDAALN